jgi:hypothetical protein
MVQVPTVDGEKLRDTLGAIERAYGADPRAELSL